MTIHIKQQPKWFIWVLVKMSLIMIYLWYCECVWLKAKIGAKYAQLATEQNWRYSIHFNHSYISTNIHQTFINHFIIQTENLSLVYDFPNHFNPFFNRAEDGGEAPKRAVAYRKAQGPAVRSSRGALGQRPGGCRMMCPTFAWSYHVDFMVNIQIYIYMCV